MKIKVKLKEIEELIEISTPILVSGDQNNVPAFHLQSNEYLKSLYGKGTFNPIMHSLCGKEIEVDDEFYEGAYQYRLDLDSNSYMDLVIGKWMVE